MHQLLVWAGKYCTRCVPLALGCEEQNIFGGVFGMTVTAAMFGVGLK